MSGPMLETPRLILRPPLQRDFDVWAELMSETEIIRFLGGVPPRASAWRAMATMAGS